MHLANEGSNLIERESIENMNCSIISIQCSIHLQVIIGHSWNHKCWYWSEHGENENETLITCNKPQLQIDQYHNVVDQSGAKTWQINGVWCSQNCVVIVKYNIWEIVDDDGMIDGQQYPAHEIFPSQSIVASVVWIQIWVPEDMDILVLEINRVAIKPNGCNTWAAAFPGRLFRSATEKALVMMCTSRCTISKIEHRRYSQPKTCYLFGSKSIISE